MSLGYVILVLVIFVVVVARITRLINADTILDKPRMWVATKARNAQLVAREAQAHGQTERERIFVSLTRRWETVLYFVQCPWCVSMWVAWGVGFVPVLLIGWPLWTVLPLGLMASHLVGVCARFADTEEMDIEDDAE